MKTRIFISMLLVTAMALTSCQKGEKPLVDPVQIELTPRAAEVIAGGNDFGIGLFRRVAQAEDQNLMLSPLSASVALTMLLNGCGGETYTQIKQMLGYPEDLTIEQVNEAYQSLVTQLLAADPKVTIALANAIFYRQDFPFKQPFLDSMAQHFEALVKGLNFGLPAAVDEINQWASDNTEGKIEKVIEEVDPATVMFLMNALYFKGDWTQSFDVSNTEDRPFFLSNSIEANVSTMYGEFEIKTNFQPSFKAIELPYGRNNFSMIVIVPEGGLEGFYDQLTPQLWAEVTGSFDTNQSKAKTHVYLPKFEFDYEKELNDQLIDMGMVDAFGPGANLLGISDLAPYVRMVKQNSFIKVDEKGTEAAAVTTVEVGIISMPPPTPVFQANKPFVFAIRERTTNTLLFIGQVVDPRSE